MNNRKLSKTVDENTFCYSSTALVKHIPNVFTVVTLANACYLCQKVIDAICNYYNKEPQISSGLRVPKLNEAVGGDDKSEHQYGNAADINIVGIPTKQLFNDIFSGRIKQANGKPLKDILDQCIYEEKLTRGKLVTWVHVGIRKTLRHQFMSKFLNHNYVIVTKEL